MTDSLHQTIERVHRHEYGQILASLLRWLGDFDLAEEALQDAFLAAIERWPASGVPERPGAWLTTAARRKALDRLRRRQSGAALLARLAAQPSAAALPDEPEVIPDERLGLMFMCCHPALPLEQQLALTLHALGGLTTAEVASAFLVPLPTMAQRLVRAKRKIAVSGIPFAVPASHLLPERLAPVLTVLYLVFTEGYAASRGDALIRQELCAEAIRLARVLERLMRRLPDVALAQQAEVLGLLALMLLHDSRRAARVGPSGDLVLLPDQDRSLWDRRQLAEGLALVEQALRMRQPGPYQIQAAISALHAGAPTADATDWTQIAALYAELLRYVDTPVIRLNQAVAVGLAQGPAAGMALLQPLADALDAYAPWHLARADVLARLGQTEAARAAYAAALELTDNAVERAFIRRRIAELAPSA